MDACATCGRMLTLRRRMSEKILNTTQQQYAKYELGVQEIPTHHLITLADYYQVSLDYMVGRAEWTDVEQWRNQRKK